MKVRWGILGTARIATKVRRAIELAENAELMAIASRSEDRAREWADEHRAPKAYGSYEALLDDPEIDAVYIPLPPSMHCEWGIAAAEAGKHVLSEKPLTMDVSEAEALASACIKHRIQLMDGVMWVHHDRTREARALIDSGALGEIRRVTSCFAFNWGETIPQENIRAHRELGGGALGDLGYYCIRGILWALGELPEAVYATSRFANNVDIETSAMLSFSRNRTASFDCGFTMNSRAWLEVAGADASLAIDNFVGPSSEERSQFYVRTGNGPREPHEIGPCVQQTKMIERFSEIVLSQTLDQSLTDAAMDTVRVCCAVDESARTGRRIEIR